MKSTGITRPVDPLGRVVIPVELRRSLNIKTDDLLESICGRRLYHAQKRRPEMYFLRQDEKHSDCTRQERLQIMFE